MNWAHYYLLVVTVIGFIFNTAAYSQKADSLSLGIYIAFYIGMAVFSLFVVFPAAGVNWGG